MTKIKNFFKSITNSKKKVFALALSVCVVVLSIASSSIAYFTDTEEYTNTFTSGNVTITLKVNDKDVSVQNAYTESGVYPGQVIERNTVITNINTSNEAFLGAIITVTDPDAALTAEIVDDLFAGLNESGRTVKVKAISGGCEIYVVFTAKYAANSTANVFTDIVIPGDWNNAQMTKFNAVEIDVVAYAVQTAGLGNDALAALQAGFDGAFDNIPTT